MNTIKKLLPLLISLLILSSCSNEIESPHPTSNVNTNDNTTVPSLDEHIHSDSEIAMPNNSEELIEKFPLDEIQAPDGTTLFKGDAIGAYDNRICFDTAFVRYAYPLFESTDTSDHLFDWETYEFNENLIKSESTDYFLIKKGDILSNGLVASNTESVFEAMNFSDEAGNIKKGVWLLKSSVEFEGEVTIEGVLYCFPGIPEYIDVQGDLKLYPNPTVDTKILVPYNTVQMPTRIVDPNRNYALIFDGVAFNLGNINEIAVDIKSLFEENDYVYCKVTIDHLRLIYDDDFAGQICYGEIKEVEVL